MIGLFQKSYGNNTTGFCGSDSVELMMIMEHEILEWGPQIS